MPREHEPFYDPTRSYEDNYSNGPFGAFAGDEQWRPPQGPQYTFLGHPLDLPLGIPAGPLVNSLYCIRAAEMGSSVPVYKTVRSRSYPSHKPPNVLAVQINGDLTPERAQEPVVVDTDYTRRPLSITNSFGVPSQDPAVWQPDMRAANEGMRDGQLLIGSFQGTVTPEGLEAFVADWVHTSKLVAKTGVPIMEMNLSCPNEGTAHLLCFDTDRVARIVGAVKAAVKTPLLIKIAHFADEAKLENFVKTIGPLVDGISAINTIPARVVNQQGEQALPGKERVISGVCGDGIRWAGLDMTRRLANLRKRLGLSYAIVGVGGIMEPAHVVEYLDAGADITMSATGAMWNPYLAQETYDYLHGGRR